MAFGGTGGGSGSLAGSSDVALNSLANAQVLTYNATSEKWVNGTATAGASGEVIRFVRVGESIQAALSGYEGKVVLERGVHSVSAPVIQARRQWVMGEGGGATIVRATAIMDAVWKIGNGAPADRTHLSDLSIDAAGRAQVGLDVNIVGTTGNYKGEPDGQVHLERLYVDDALETGIWARGIDTQALHAYGCRVRRAGDYGFRIEAPDSWYTDCEATTSTAGTGAGFYVASSNLHFHGCKAWYTRGYGWHVRGTRNAFTNCESQDTRLHGWNIEWDKNTFVGCIADSAGYADVGGVSNTQDGFYLASGLKFTSMTGCMSFDREQGYPANQRYGFNMSASTYNIGRSSNGTAAPTGSSTLPVMIAALTGGLPAEANYKNISGLLNLR